MKQKITVTVEVDVLGYDGKRSIPFLYQDAATIDDASTPIDRVGVSMGNPFVFYLFSKSEPGPNGNYIATVNMSDALQGVLHQLPTLVAAEQDKLAAVVDAAIADADAAEEVKPDDNA